MKFYFIFFVFLLFSSCGSKFPLNALLTKDSIGVYEGVLNKRGFKVEILRAAAANQRNDNLILAFYWTDASKNINKVISEYITSPDSFNSTFCKEIAASNSKHYTDMKGKVFASISDITGSVFGYLFQQLLSSQLSLIALEKQGDGYVIKRPDLYSFIKTDKYGEVRLMNWKVKDNLITEIQLLETGFVKLSWLLHASNTLSLPVYKSSNTSNALGRPIAEYYRLYTERQVQFSNKYREICLSNAS